MPVVTGLPQCPDTNLLSDGEPPVPLTCGPPGWFLIPPLAHAVRGRRGSQRPTPLYLSTPARSSDKISRPSIPAVDAEDLAIAQRVERKLAAICAADVVGYSRLVGADEAGTIARLRALREEFIEPLIAEYRGRVVKLVGDGALVEFASAVDAVECAVALQHGVAEREAVEPEDRRIAFRIGINVGDIIVENGDILGDGVNVAARLEGLAEPRGICLAHSVHNQVRTKLALPFEPMGEHRVKNIADPVEVWRVVLDGVCQGHARRVVASRRSLWLLDLLRWSLWAAPAHGGGTRAVPPSKRSWPTRCSRCRAGHQSPFFRSRT
jgi:class 3 adenylate cyclase